MEKKLLVLGFVAIFWQQAFGLRVSHPYRVSCVSRLTQPLGARSLWSDFNATLDAEMRKGEDAIERLYVPASGIGRVIAVLDEGAHGSVVVVETDAGPMALKLYFREQEDSLELSFGPLEHENDLAERGFNPARNKIPIRYVAPLLIQEILGELDVGPRVRGVVPPKELAHLRPRLAKHLDEVNFSHAVLMDRIGKERSLKWGVVPTHPALTRETVDARLQYIGTVMRHLRIHPDDGDLIISTEGKVYALDFEFYSWTSPDGWNYSNHGVEFVGISGRLADPRVLVETFAPFLCAMPYAPTPIAWSSDD